MQHTFTERLGDQFGFVQREPEPLADCEAGSPHREWCVPVDHVGDLTRPNRELVVLDHFGDQSEIERALGGQPLLLAEQRHPHRDIDRDRAREPHHLPTRHDPDADVRIEELRTIGRDRDVAGGHEVEAGTAADPVDCHHDRLRHGTERRGRLLRRVPLTEVRQVPTLVRNLSIGGHALHIGA